MWDDLAEKSLQKIPSSHAQMGVIKCVMRYSILAVCNMHTPSENEGPLNSISLLCHPMKKNKNPVTFIKAELNVFIFFCIVTCETTCILLLLDGTLFDQPLPEII